MLKTSTSPVKKTDLSAEMELFEQDHYFEEVLYMADVVDNFQK